MSKKGFDLLGRTRGGQVLEDGVITPLLSAFFRVLKGETPFRVGAEELKRVEGIASGVKPRMPSAIERRMEDVGGITMGERNLAEPGKYVFPSPTPKSVRNYIPPVEEAARAEVPVRSVREMMENPAGVSFVSPELLESISAGEKVVDPKVSTALINRVFPEGTEFNQLRIGYAYPKGTVVDGVKVGGRAYNPATGSPENLELARSMGQQRVSDITGAPDFPEADVYRTSPNQPIIHSTIDPEGQAAILNSQRIAGAPSIPTRQAPVRAVAEAVAEEAPTASRMGSLGTHLTDLTAFVKDNPAKVGGLALGGALATNYALQRGATPGSDIVEPTEAQKEPLSAKPGEMSNIPVAEQYVNNPNYGQTSTERQVLTNALQEVSNSAQQADPFTAAAIKAFIPNDVSQYDNLGDYYAAEKAFVEALTTGQIAAIADILRTEGTQLGDAAADTFAQSQKRMAFRAAYDLVGEDKLRELGLLNDPAPSMQTGESTTTPTVTAPIGSDNNASAVGHGNAAANIEEASLLPAAMRPGIIQGQQDLMAVTAPQVQPKLTTAQGLLHQTLLGQLG